MLAYRLNETVTGLLVSVDRNGREERPVVQDPLPNPQNPRLSPDGKRVALMLGGNLWVYSLTGRPPVKLTFDGSSDIPLWTPDGQRLVYASNASPTRLLSVSSSGISNDTPQPVSPMGHYHPHGWSTDGRQLIAVQNSYSPTNWDILGIPVDEKGATQPILKRDQQRESQAPRFRPTVGGWRNVQRDRDARSLRPAVSRARRSSAGSPNGGAKSILAKSGANCFTSKTEKMMAVSVVGPPFDFAKPVVLSTSVYLHPAGSPLSYDVAADGRFIMLKRVDTHTVERRFMWSELGSGLVTLERIGPADFKPLRRAATVVSGCFLAQITSSTLCRRIWRLCKPLSQEARIPRSQRFRHDRRGFAPRLECRLCEARSATASSRGHVVLTLSAARKHTGSDINATCHARSGGNAAGCSQSFLCESRRSLADSSIRLGHRPSLGCRRILRVPPTQCLQIGALCVRHRFIAGDSTRRDLAAAPAGLYHS